MTSAPVRRLDNAVVLRRVKRRCGPCGRRPTTASSAGPVSARRRCRRRRLRRNAQRPALSAGFSAAPAFSFRTIRRSRAMWESVWPSDDGRRRDRRVGVRHGGRGLEKDTRARSRRHYRLQGRRVQEAAARAPGPRGDGTRIPARASRPRSFAGRTTSLRPKTFSKRSTFSPPPRAPGRPPRVRRARRITFFRRTSTRRSATRPRCVRSSARRRHGEGPRASGPPVSCQGRAGGRPGAGPGGAFAVVAGDERDRSALVAREP